jgi:hypothetical protein
MRLIETDRDVCAPRRCRKARFAGSLDSCPSRRAQERQRAAALAANSQDASRIRPPRFVLGGVASYTQGRSLALSAEFFNLNQGKSA